MSAGAFKAGSVTSQMGLDTSPFTHGMLEAQGIMELFPHWVGMFMADPLLGLVDMLKEAGHAVWEFTTSFNESTVQIEHLATSLGVSVEFLSRWGRAAEMFGANANDIASAVRWLDRQMFEANTGNKAAAEGFQRLGIAVADAAGKLREPEQILPLIADGLSRVENGAERARLATMLLGRGAAGLTQFFAQGATEIERLAEQAANFGAVITPAMEESAKAAHKAGVELHWAWVGIQAAMAQKVTPAIIDALHGISNWIANNGQTINTALSTIQTMAELAGRGFLFLLEHGKTLAELLGGALAVGALRFVSLLRGMELGALGAAGKMMTLTLALAAAADAMIAANSLASGNSAHKGSDWGTIIGTGAGTVIGAVAGYFVGNPYMGAQIGASVGNVAGKMIGSHWDDPEAANRGSNVTVRNQIDYHGGDAARAADEVSRKTKMLIESQLRSMDARNSNDRIRLGI